jgi:hypothetical protein
MLALTGRSEQREPRSGAAACSAIFNRARLARQPATWDGKVPGLDTDGFYRERTTPLPDWRRTVK